MAHGAVLRALDKEGGPVRITRTSFGFLRSEPFDKDLIEAHVGVRRDFDKLDGMYYIRNTIDWLVKKVGFSVPLEKSAHQ